MEDDGDKHHDKDFTEKDNIDRDDIGHQVDPEDDVQGVLGHIVLDEVQLVNGGQDGSVAAWHCLQTLHLLHHVTAGQVPAIVIVMLYLVIVMS